MRIRPTDLVLEIGSGNNPHPRANILCDRYLYDNSDRAGGFPVVVDRPFVIADGQKLPFGDKQFDYVICSHILEHIQNPKRFIAELTRVGKSGFIEVPSIVSERIFGWDFHHWHIDRSGGRLRLWKKKEGERFGGFFHRLIAGEIWFRRFFEEHEAVWYVRLEWSDTIDIRVSKHPISPRMLATYDLDARKLLASAGPSLWADALFYRRWMMRRLVRKAIKILRRVSWNGRIFLASGQIRTDLFKLLLCPSCLGQLRISSNETLSCVSCRSEYTICGVMPIMILPRERKKGY